MIVMSVLLGGLALAGVGVPVDSIVKGQQEDNPTLFPPAGTIVNGHYKTEPFDDGERIIWSKIIYRGDLGGDGFLVSGWFHETIHLNYHDGTKAVGNRLTVHASDPRYTDTCTSEPCWQEIVYVDSGEGNTA